MGAISSLANNWKSWFDKTGVCDFHLLVVIHRIRPEAATSGLFACKDYTNLLFSEIKMANYRLCVLVL